MQLGWEADIMKVTLVRRLVVLGSVLAVMAMGAWPAFAKADVCVSVDGDIKVEGTNSICNTTDGNTAVAINDSEAYADNGTDSMALAVNGSESFAVEGDNNNALAVNGSISHAWTPGDDRMSLAINGSEATAQQDGATATAVNESVAVASPGGDALAVNNSCAAAYDDSSNSATAINDSHAVAAEGSGNTATAINDSAAYAAWGSGNDVEVFARNGESAPNPDVAGSPCP
jgi:hypothetical protein